METVEHKVGDIIVNAYGPEWPAPKLIEQHWRVTKVHEQGPSVELVATFETPGTWTFSPSGEKVRTWTEPGGDQ